MAEAKKSTGRLLPQEECTDGEMRQVSELVEDIAGILDGTAGRIAITALVEVVAMVHVTEQRKDQRAVVASLFFAAVMARIESLSEDLPE